MQSPTNENIRNENVNDIFLRNATISLLDILNKEIVIELRRDDKIEKHKVPVFYNFGGDEGFMKDFFVELPENCNYPNHAEGNYDVMPRGIITLQNFIIRSSDITNKFVRGTFHKEEKNENDEKVMKAFSSRLMSIPLTLKFDIKFESDNINKTFKIMERVFDFYYKNHVVYFQYRGIRIPGQFTFPENENFQKKYDFTYSDDKKVTINFGVDMETYFPSFQEHGMMYKGNTIRQFLLKNKIKGSDAPISTTWTDTDYPPTE